MRKKKNLSPEIIEQFKQEFSEDISTLNLLVGYQVLIAEIEEMVEEDSKHVLAQDIKDLIAKFKANNS